MAAANNPDAGSEATIRHLLDRMVAAWDSGDADAFAAVFAIDCDYITFNGQRLRGRVEVAETHRELFSTHLKGSRLIFESSELRFLDRTTAIVQSVGNTALAGQDTPPPARRSRQTLVAVEVAGEWRFAAFQNTRIFELTPFRAILMKLGL